MKIPSRNMESNEYRRVMLNKRSIAQFSPLENNSRNTVASRKLKSENLGRNLRVTWLFSLTKRWHQPTGRDRRKIRKDEERGEWKSVCTDEPPRPQVHDATYQKRSRECLESENGGGPGKGGGIISGKSERRACGNLSWNLIRDRDLSPRACNSSAGRRRSFAAAVSLSPLSFADK